MTEQQTEKKEEQGNRSRRTHRERWLVIAAIIVSIVIAHFAVAPIVGLREEINERGQKLSMLDVDIPPSALIFTVVNGEKPRTEYTPSHSYDLYTEQKLRFKNPLLWAWGRTYHPPHEGSELIQVAQPENIKYRMEDNRAVTLWPTARFPSKERSSVELVWKQSGCSADDVQLEVQEQWDGTRVRAWNRYDYPVTYLGEAELPPVKTNTIYIIQDWPPEVCAPWSLEVRSVKGIEGSVKVELPIVIEIGKGTVLTFDVQVSEQPPRILLRRPQVLPSLRRLSTGDWQVFLGEPLPFGGEVVSLKIEGPDKVVATLEPTPVIRPDVFYRVSLYTNDQLFSRTDILWNEYELMQGVEKPIIFDDVPLYRLHYVHVDMTPVGLPP